MNRHRPLLLTLALLVPLGGGCMPTMTIEEFKASQPPRPVQLDRLDMLLGHWETKGEVRMIGLDEPLHTSGRNTAAWSMDNRVMVDHSDLDMGPMGRMTGMSVWGWDPAIRKYRMWWFDSMGETSQMIVTYDAKRETFFMRGTGQKYGCHTRGKGTIRRIDDDTLEWTWREYDITGLFKMADMKGISRRQ